MIKIENVVTPSPQQWNAVVRGIRNPFSSWDRSDSKFIRKYDFVDNDHQIVSMDDKFKIGEADMTLMKKLASAGDDHGKFMRMLPVMADITAPLTWWKQMDQYKIGTVTDSTSTMHCIQREEFTLENFETADIDNETFTVMMEVIKELNRCRTLYNTTHDKKYWNSMINLLPESYLQKRTWAGNYQVLKRIYNSRKGHKLDDWIIIRGWITTLPYANELIIGD